MSPRLHPDSGSGARPASCADPHRPPIAVEVSGYDQAGPAVVLEAGLGASSAGWSRVRERLAAQVRVITYDRTGLGASPPSTAMRSLDALTADLIQVIRTHGGGPVVVVGHSLGATLARHLAAVRPDLIAGLVLIDPVPEHWVLRHGAWVAPVGQLGYLMLEFLARCGVIDVALGLPLLRGITRSSTSPLAAFTAAERGVLADEVRNPASHRTARREFTGLLWHSRACLRTLRTAPSIAVPFTVMSGGTTTFFSTPLRRAATRWQARLAAVPDGRHLIINDGGHFIPRYRPDVVVNAVAELLDRMATRSPA